MTSPVSRTLRVSGTLTVPALPGYPNCRPEKRSPGRDLVPRRSKPLFAAPEGLGIAFGETRYASGVGKTFELTLSGTKRDLRAQLRGKCPGGPGVYGFVDRLGKLTYVGMSKNLRKRLTTYLS